MAESGVDNVGGEAGEGLDDAGVSGQCECFGRVDVERDATPVESEAGPAWPSAEMLQRPPRVPGSGAAACRTHWSTTPDKLTITQAALLAGMADNPETYDPFAHPQAAMERRNEVIVAMNQEK